MSLEYQAENLATGQVCCVEYAVCATEDDPVFETCNKTMHTASRISNSRKLLSVGL